MCYLFFGLVEGWWKAPALRYAGGSYVWALRFYAGGCSKTLKFVLSIFWATPYITGIYLTTIIPRNFTEYVPLPRWFTCYSCIWNQRCFYPSSSYKKNPHTRHSVQGGFLFCGSRKLTYLPGGNRKYSVISTDFGHKNSDGNGNIIF